MDLINYLNNIVEDVKWFTMIVTKFGKEIIGWRISCPVCCRSEKKNAKKMNSWSWNESQIWKDGEWIQI